MIKGHQKVLMTNNFLTLKLVSEFSFEKLKEMKKEKIRRFLTRKVIEKKL